ncbi:hypothetical protein L0Y69_01375 [bacterium]|nr:hypothetical protein [bacterium]
MPRHSCTQKSKKEAEQAKKVLADFCGVQMSTVKRWITGAGSSGETWCKLACYLDAQGCKVIELERLPKVRRNFLEIIGFGILSGAEAASLLGYTEAYGLYGVLRGKENPSTDKEERMWSAWKAKREEIEERKGKIKGAIRKDVETPTESIEAIGGVTRTTALVGIIKGVSDLLRDVSFIASKDELETLRSVVAELAFQVIRFKPETERKE